MWWLLAILLWSLPAWAGHNEPVGCTQTPALIGDTTTPTGSCVTTDNLHKISTQTAAASASMQWTGLATYNTYLLTCAGVFPATNSTTTMVQFGEGGTPTWETANYKWANSYTGSGTSATGAQFSSSDAGIAIKLSATNTIAESGNITLWIYGITSTTANKQVSGTLSGFGSPNNYTILVGGQYAGDTNAVTAIRVIAASGNITGTCSLYGVGQ